MTNCISNNWNVCIMLNNKSIRIQFIIAIKILRIHRKCAIQLRGWKPCKHFPDYIICIEHNIIKCMYTPIEKCLFANAHM